MPAVPEFLRFMILDDEAIIALDLAGMLQDLGHTVVSMANRVAGGMEFAKHGDLDMAILDINVHGVTSFPLATVLQDRGVPFIFASGYGESGLIDGFRDALVLTKPYGMDDLTQVVAKARVAAA
jgi:two-component SAPR family response regulator